MEVNDDRSLITSIDDDDIALRSNEDHSNVNPKVDLKNESSLATKTEQLLIPLRYEDSNQDETQDSGCDKEESDCYGESFDEVSSDNDEDEEPLDDHFCQKEKPDEETKQPSLVLNQHLRGEKNKNLHGSNKTTGTLSPRDSNTRVSHRSILKQPSYYIGSGRKLKKNSKKKVQLSVRNSDQGNSGSTVSSSSFFDESNRSITRQLSQRQIGLPNVESDSDENHDDVDDLAKEKNQPHQSARSLSTDEDLMNQFLARQQNIDIQYTISVSKEEFDSLHQYVDDLAHKLHNLSKEVQRVKVSTKINKNTSYSYFDINGQRSHMTTLSSDSFSLMKVAPFASWSWCFSLAVTVVQLVLLIMIFSQQCSFSVVDSDNSDFHIPFKSDWYMIMAQVMAIIVTVAVSRDLFIPIKELSNLWISNKIQWSRVVGISIDYADRTTWINQILIPNLLQLVIGALALLVSFVIIIQSDNVIELFAEFAAMSIIGEIDNVAFWFAESGFVGDDVRQDAKQVKQVQFEDSTKKTRFFGFMQLRSTLFLALLIVTITAFTVVAYRQSIGYYFEQMYPGCDISLEEIKRLNDGVCHGGFVNSYQCGFDGGVSSSILSIHDIFT